MKTKHILLAFFISTFTFFANAQTVVMDDDFTSNKNNWAESDNADATLQVRNNRYYFEHKRTSGGWSSTKVIEIDENKDFEIESQFLKVSGIKNNGFGFVFGRKDGNNQFVFTITANGSYSIDQYIDGKYTAIKEWTKSEHIKKGNYAYNTLKIKKENGFIKFYINDRYITLYTHKPFMGNRLGFVIYNNQKIAINNLKVKYINQSNVNTNLTTTSGNSVINDDFSSNKNNWAESDNEDATLQIRNDRYNFEHKRTSGGWSTTKVVNIDENKEFEIESKFLKISGIQNNGYGFVFGRKDSNNQFVFTITANGSYSIDQYVDGKYTAIKKWTKSEHIKKGNYANNTLKIKKERGFIKFYVNDRYLTLYTHKPFMGKRLGFVIYNNQKIAINNLKVKYINQSNVNNNLTTTTSGSVILKDDFSSNKNEWAESNREEADLEIRNGKYYFDHKRSSKGWTTTKVVHIDDNKDFEIESRFLKIDGISNNGYGFVFGRKDGENQYVFTITANGSYSIDQYIDGKYTALKDWTKSSHIKTGNNVYNTLKIKKERGFIKFYVNDRYLTLYTHKPFMGNRFGFVVYHKQKVAVDDLSIKYINQNNNNPKDNIVTANGETVLSDYFTDNKNDWPSTNTDDDTKMSIANNYYNFEHLKEKGGWAVNIPKTIDTSRDFEIVTAIKKVSGVENTSYGFQWGKEGQNSFRFYITGNGYYKISRVVDGKEQLIKKFAKSSAIKTGNGGYNKLKIRKEGDQYKYYINDTFVTQTDFESFYGHRLGYVVYNKQKVSVDYITVKYLKKSKNTIVTSNTLKVPLNESFASNTNGWNLSDDTNLKTRISNGKLYVKSNNEKGGAFISKKVGIDTSRDFIIETSLTRLSSTSKGSIAFVFGRQNNTNEFDLFLSKDGSYLFRKLENDVSNKLIPWTETSALNTQSYQANKIKIVKSNNLLRIYINDQYVNEAPYSKFFGDYIGFSVYNNQEISIDYLNVTYPSSSFNTPPEVVITEPVVQRGFKIVKTKKVLVKGKATDKDGIYEITINGIEAVVAENGTFTANVPLKYGANDLIVKATDMKQASSTKKFTIKRKSPDVVVDDVVVDNNDNINSGKGFGEYYALLIGVSDYGDGAITDLGGLPTKDAKDLGNILINKYSFKRENVVILNNSPKANDIIKEFSKLKKRVTNKDNVLVFYAGHGIYDEVSQIGAWLPSDADMEYELNLISNSQVVDFLKSIRSKHTLLISDACFSGGIFKTRSFNKSPKSIQKKFELSSRKAITSGTLKTVPNKSMFLKYLLNRLETNSNKYLSARQLFGRIEEPVMNNSPNTPQYGIIHGIGDEGGDFIFIKKQ